jgi:hypothetical protein
LVFNASLRVIDWYCDPEAGSSAHESGTLTMPGLRRLACVFGSALILLLGIVACERGGAPTRHRGAPVATSPGDPGHHSDGPEPVFDKGIPESVDKAMMLDLDSL